MCNVYVALSRAGWAAVRSQLLYLGHIKADQHTMHSHRLITEINRHIALGLRAALLCNALNYSQKFPFCRREHEVRHVHAVHPVLMQRKWTSQGNESAFINLWILLSLYLKEFEGNASPRGSGNTASHVLYILFFLEFISLHVSDHVPARREWFSRDLI